MRARAQRRPFAPRSSRRVAPLPKGPQLRGSLVEFAPRRRGLRPLRGCPPTRLVGLRGGLSIRSAEPPPPAAGAVPVAQQGRRLAPPLHVLPHVGVEQLAV